MPDPVRFTITGLDLVRFGHVVDPCGQTYMRPDRWSGHPFDFVDG